MAGEKDIKQALKEGKLLMGRTEVVRAMKRGSLVSVFCPSNCPPDLLRELEHGAALSKGKLEVQKFTGNSARLGQSCGKPFNITVLGIKK